LQDFYKNDPLPKYLEKATVLFPDDKPSHKVSIDQKVEPNGIKVTSRLLGHKDKGRPDAEGRSLLKPLSISGNVSSTLALLSTEAVLSHETSTRGMQSASKAFSIKRKPLLQGGN
jgi:hypothetical protein